MCIYLYNMYGTRPDQNDEYDKLLIFNPQNEDEARTLILEAIVYVNKEKDNYIAKWAFLGLCDYLSDYDFMIHIGTDQVRKIAQRLIDEGFCDNFSKRNQKWIYERLNSYRQGVFLKDIPYREVKLDKVA